VLGPRHRQSGLDEPKPVIHLPQFDSGLFADERKPLLRIPAPFVALPEALGGVPDEGQHPRQIGWIE
jgi:hypothetical protein